MNRTYRIKGVNVSGIAPKIEQNLNSLADVTVAQIDSNKELLTIETKNYPLTKEEILKNIKQIDPHLTIIEIKHLRHLIRNFFSNIDSYLTVLGVSLLIITFFLSSSSSVTILLYLLSYLLVTYKMLFAVVKNILSGQIFDEVFLMGIASIGAFLLRDYREAIAIIIFYIIGEYFQDRAVDRSKREIQTLMDISPDTANQNILGAIKIVPTKDLNPGDEIIIKPGERVPLDAIVTQGSSFLDTSALTGEAIPIATEVGQEIFSGSINLNGILYAKVTRNLSESTVTKILDLVQNASNKKAKTEQFITKFSRYYTPAVVGLAALTALLPPLLFDVSFSIWINRALIFLIVSCPCALVISIPLTFFGGIGAASRNGILVKGGNYLEALNNIGTVVFDKTGTLTKGNFTVTKIIPSKICTSEDLLKIAAHAEHFSNHPIAKSIVKTYSHEIDSILITNFSEVAGKGLTAEINNQFVIAGNSKFIQEHSIIPDEVEMHGTLVHVAADSNYLGCIVIADGIKPDSYKTVLELAKIGVKKQIMLTGDSKKNAVFVQNELGISDVYYELLPHEKVEHLEEIMEQHSSRKNVIFVGDGMNDAPVLAMSDVGVAMGGIGSDAAIEAADIIITTDQPSRIVTAIKIAKKTRKIVWQNIIFALGVKFLVLLMATIGIATLWSAVFADVGVAIIAILNTLRVLRGNYSN